MTLILPTSADWPSFNLPDGLGYVDGQLCELVHPESWQGCVGAWSQALDQQPWDYTRHGQHASRFGGVLDTGYGWFCDGSDDYMEATARGVSGLPLSFTAWVTWLTTENLGAVIGLFNSSSGTEWFAIGSRNSTNMLSAVSRSTAEGLVFAESGSPTLGKPLHMAGVFHSTSLRELYLDGVLVASNTSASNPVGPFDKWGIMRNSDSSPSGNVHGICDDLRAYNRVLRPTEIAILAARPNVAYQCKPLRKWFVVSGGGAFDIAADAGAYSIAGQTSQLLTGRKLSADVAAMSLAAQASTLKATRLVSAEAGAVAIAGQAASPLVGRKVDAQVASYSLAGQAAGLKLDAKVSANVGEFDITGFVASLLASGDVPTPSFVIVAAREPREVTIGKELRTLQAEAETRVLKSR